ncbi:MAG: exonuclease domain-containing protein [Flavobacteriaceae bacterium]|nr:exonuclease domain-containing protein [Flavobacteriaceae bacterium]
MYAILDIETTGGKFNEEGITEIAIYKFDGQEVVDQFSCLVNPEKPIQPFVVNLTGINQNMLRSAPKFYEVAKRIIEITDGCILVAHNAVFDYRVLRMEFDRLGYPFERNTLCTVELSKSLIPEMQSYSLGKLVRALGIPMSDRHRATGDAMATVKLFKLLLDKDHEKQILKALVRSQPIRQLEPKLLQIIDQLPAETGLYYFHREDGEVIYIGKSKNIKKRVTQHFTGQNRKSKKIQQFIAAVTFETTGSELIALLKESEEIKKNKPIFNVAQRKTFFGFALYCQTNEAGYHCLSLEKNDGRKKSIISFANYEEGKSFLYKLAEEHNLCQKLLGLYPDSGACFSRQTKVCLGACVHEESAESHNRRLLKTIEKFQFQNKNILIIERGRSHDEKAVVLIENGDYKGFGFFHLNYQIQHIEVLRSLITPMENNRDTIRIIQSFVRKRQSIKIIEF